METFWLCNDVKFPLAFVSLKNLLAIGLMLSKLTDNDHIMFLFITGGRRKDKTYVV